MKSNFLFYVLVLRLVYFARLALQEKSFVQKKITELDSDKTVILSDCKYPLQAFSCIG